MRNAFQMKRVLLLAYFFPPRQAAGTPRAAHLAKYLERFNWQVTVITPKFSNGKPPSWATVVQTEDTDIIVKAKRFLGLPKNISGHQLLGSPSPKAGSLMTMRQRLVEASFKAIAFPDPHIGWLKHAVPVVLEELVARKYQAIISTSFPYTAHLIARRSLARHHTPWIADLRDPWRGNSLITGVPSLVHSLLERRTLHRANAITTVSAPLAQQIGSNNPDIPTYEIRNAFDPEDWDKVTFERPRQFTLTYAGSLYQGLRDPEPLFDVLLELISSKILRRDNIRVIFYTQAEEWLSQAVERRGLEDVVAIKGYVEREQVLRAERATSVNLLLLRDMPGENAVYTGKLFEYIGANLPILSIGGPPQSVVRDVLARIGGLYATNREELRDALLKLYQAHEAGLDVRLHESVASEFSAPVMAQRFAQLLDAISRI